MVNVARPCDIDRMSVAYPNISESGTLALIDSRLDPESSATNHPRPENDFSVRRLDDGREFTIVKVFYEPAELAAALEAAGFAAPSITVTSRFFILGYATAGG